MTGGGGHPGAACHKYYLANTKLSILPARLYSILTVTLRALLLISSLADVETDAEWLDNLLTATEVTVRGEKIEPKFVCEQVCVFLTLTLSPR